MSGVGRTASANVGGGARQSPDEGAVQGILTRRTFTAEFKLLTNDSFTLVKTKSSSIND